MLDPTSRESLKFKDLLKVVWFTFCTFCSKTIKKTAHVRGHFQCNVMCFQVLIDWINSELEEDRIIVKDLEEDCYDGQVLQKLFGKNLVSIASQRFCTPWTWSCMKICNIFSRRKYLIHAVGQHKVCWCAAWNMKKHEYWLTTYLYNSLHHLFRKKVKVILKQFSILLAACSSSIKKGLRRRKTSLKRSSAHASYVMSWGDRFKIWVDHCKGEKNHA